MYVYPLKTYVEIKFFIIISLKARFKKQEQLAHFIKLLDQLASHSLQLFVLLKILLMDEYCYELF